MTKIVGLLQRAGIVILRALATLLVLFYYLLYPLGWLGKKWLAIIARAIRSEINYRKFVAQAMKLWLLSALLIYGITIVGTIGYAIFRGVSMLTVVEKFPLIIVYLVQLMDEEITVLTGALGIVCLLLKPMRFLYREKLLLPWAIRLIDRF